MIISSKTNRLNSRWLQVCVLLCAMLVLPLGFASAQDYEAVGKRLRAAVAAGELTGEQARAMLGSLRKAGGAKKDQGSDRAKAYLMKVRKDLGAAVEAGRISKEDAAKRYEAAEKGIQKRMATGCACQADIGPVPPANQKRTEPRTDAPKWPHFRDLKPTTLIQLNNPLSANSKKSRLHKLFSVNGLQKAEELVTFSMAGAILCAILEHSLLLYVRSKT